MSTVEQPYDRKKSQEEWLRKQKSTMEAERKKRSSEEFSSILDNVREALVNVNELTGALTYDRQSTLSSESYSTMATSGSSTLSEESEFERFCGTPLSKSPSESSDVLDEFLPLFGAPEIYNELVKALHNSHPEQVEIYESQSTSTSKPSNFREVAAGIPAGLQRRLSEPLNKGTQNLSQRSEIKNDAKGKEKNKKKASSSKQTKPRRRQIEKSPKGERKIIARTTHGAFSRSPTRTTKSKKSRSTQKPFDLKSYASEHQEEIERATKRFEYDMDKAEGIKNFANSKHLIITLILGYMLYMFIRPYFVEDG